MVKALAELDLLVVCIDILTKRFRLAEVKWSTLHFQNLASRNGRVIGRKIEVSIDLANLVFDSGSWVCCSCQTEEGMMCQIDNRLLVGGSQLLNDQFVFISKCEFYCYVQLTSKAFLTIGGLAVQG